MVLSGAVIVELGPDGGNITDFTVADGTTISGGNLMVMTAGASSTGRVARSSTGADPGEDLVKCPPAGIAVADKLADDGQVNLGLYTTGIFDISCVEAISGGALVMISGANTVARLPAIQDYVLSGGMIFGRAMNDAAVGGTVEVKIGGAIL